MGLPLQPLYNKSGEATATLFRSHSKIALIDPIVRHTLIDPIVLTLGREMPATVLPSQAACCHSDLDRQTRVAPLQLARVCVPYTFRGNDSIT